MRLRAAVLASIVVGALGVGYAQAPSASSATQIAACANGYVSAHLSWGSKCLRAGEFCKVGNAQYARYGFYCPATGHLRRR